MATGAHQAAGSLLLTFPKLSELRQGNGVLPFQLRALAGRAVSFLEWGSGTGVITIMADMLGFEAYGIEINPALVASDGPHIRQMVADLLELGRQAAAL